MNESERPIVKNPESRAARAVNRLLILVYGEDVVNPPPQPPKRIVSKAEYISFHIERTRRGIHATLAVLLGLLCAFITFLSSVLVLLMLCLSTLLHQGSLFAMGRLLISLLITAGLGVSAYKLLGWGVPACYQIQQEYIDIVPLTRFNAADLKASDSLVRASERPAETQENVLLRASTGRTNEGAEQLLRAADGGSEEK